MSSTIRLDYDSNLKVIETFSNGISTDNTATFGPLNESDSLTASTGVPVTKHAPFNLTMSGGSGTINLAALPGKTADETVVGTGLKVQAMKFRNKSTNANLITIAKGGSSGYGLGASGADWTIPLSPGQTVLVLGDEANPDVASGARTIDVTGTLAQVLECHIVLG